MLILLLLQTKLSVIYDALQASMATPEVGNDALSAKVSALHEQVDSLQSAIEKLSKAVGDQRLHENEVVEAVSAKVAALLQSA